MISSPARPIMIYNSITFPPNGDDYIGTESCIDLQNETESNDAPAPASGIRVNAKSSSKKKEKRVFPPPIPLLARTQNLASHMPWVLKRYYTSEGRLILKEEKVKHHEYFHAHRANGRLTLQLVLLGGDDNEFFWTNEEEAASTSPHHEEIHNSTTHDDENKVSINVADELSVESDNGVVVGGANGGLKCLNCNPVRSAPSCIFGVPLHPIRTVHG